MVLDHLDFGVEGGGWRFNCGACYRFIMGLTNFCNFQLNHPSNKDLLEKELRVIY